MVMIMTTILIMMMIKRMGKTSVCLIGECTIWIIFVIFLSLSVESSNLLDVTKYLRHTLVLCYSVFFAFACSCVTGVRYGVLLPPPGIPIVYICTYVYILNATLLSTQIS